MEKLVAEAKKELENLEVDARSHREAEGEVLSNVCVCVWCVTPLSVIVQSFKRCSETILQLSLALVGSDNLTQ